MPHARFGKKEGRLITGDSVASMRAKAEFYLDDDKPLIRDLANMLLDVLDASNEHSLNSELNYMYYHLLRENN